MAQRVLSATDIANRGMRHRKEPYDARVPRGTGRFENTTNYNRGQDKIRTMGMFFALPQTGSPPAIGQPWNIADLLTGTCIKGRNWEMYRDKLLAMGYPAAAWIDTTNQSQPAFQVGGIGYGDAVCALASFFDIVFFGHWAADNVYARIKTLAAQAGRTIEVGPYFVNYESINQSGAWNPAEEVMRLLVKNSYLLTGTGANSYGCTRVDNYELSAGATACPPADAADTVHTWYANCGDVSGAQATAFASLLASTLASHWPTNRPNVILVDNALQQPNWGSATNEPVVSAGDYVEYYTLGMDAIIPAIAPTKLWCNTGNVTLADYSAATIPNRYGEFFMHLNGDSSQLTSKLLTTFQSELNTAKANGITMAMDHARKSGEVDQWATSTGPGGTKGTWTDLQNHMTNQGLRNNMVAVAMRMSGGFYGHWQPEVFGTL